RFGEGNAMPRDAAIYSGDILGRSSRDVAERTAGLDAFLIPAHAAKPQLGAALVVWRIQRIYKGGTDRTAPEQRLKLEGRAARIGSVGIKPAGNRKRYRRVHEIMCHKLQQVRVPRRDVRVFPAFDR